MVFISPSDPSGRQSLRPPCQGSSELKQLQPKADSGLCGLLAHLFCGQRLNPIWCFGILRRALLCPSPQGLCQGGALGFGVK